MTPAPTVEAELAGALRRLLNDSMFKDHPVASQMAIDALTRYDASRPAPEGDVTDEMVEAAAQVHWDDNNIPKWAELDAGEHITMPWKPLMRNRMRAALIAALSKQCGTP